MAIVRDMSRAQLAFELPDSDPDRFQVIRFRGSEGLCQLYRFEIDLLAQQSGMTLEAVVGKPAALSINTGEGERFFHGIVSRFEMTGETVGQTYFRAELVPAVWLLTHRYDSRIFQGKTIKEIITTILTEGGIAADHFDMSKVEGLDTPREFCVQYRETDLNFICRLMEEVGIWWFFEHTQDKHVLVMSSKLGDYQPIEGEANLPYRPPTGMNVQDPHVYRFRMAQTIRPGATVLTDFNFENPKLDLETKGDSGRDPSLYFFDYPGEYADQAQGTKLAGIRAKEFESSRFLGVGQSNCRRIATGRTFNLTEHPSASFNGSFVVTRIMHQGKQSTGRTTTGSNGRTRVLDSQAHQSLVAARQSENPQIRELAEALLQVATRLQGGDPTANRALTQWLYHAGQVSRDLPSTALASGGNPLEWLSIPNLIADVAHVSVVDFDSPEYDCRFECLPATVAFVPPRVTPWPVMRGCQTARVVGPEGEEIHTDKFGRVKVQFHWDRLGLEGGNPKRHGADSSCFIRVSQGMAGGAYGHMFIPRVGQEVVVDFLEGNPNMPLIVGRVYNADHMPPYELPKEKTKSVIKTHTSKGGGGNNEIRFEDLKDKEQLFIQAQRQMDTRVKASHFHTVGGSYHVKVGGEDKDGNLSGELRELIYKAKFVHLLGELRTWIELDESRAVDGNVGIDIGGSRGTGVGGDVVDDFGANHKHTVAATYYLDAADIKLQAAGTIELVCGGSSIVLTAGGIYIEGPVVNINSGRGPSVTPPAIEAGDVELPEDADPADSSEPGKDTRYTGPSVEPPKLPPQPEVPGHDFPDEPPPETATHFIEIELKDEAGNPIAGERYEITTPDGKVRHGTTDAAGHAREDNLQEGECQINFPRLDEAAWVRSTGP